MNLRYKRITTEDIPFVHELFGVTEYHPIFFEGSTTLQDWYDRFEHISSFEIVYEGTRRIGVRNIEIKDTIQILLLAVLSNLRHHGYGTRMIEDIVEEYPHQKIFVTVKESNTNAVQFYTKMGFNPLSQETQDLGMNGIHTYINMQK